MSRDIYTLTTYSSEPFMTLDDEQSRVYARHLPPWDYGSVDDDLLLYDLPTVTFNNFAMTLTNWALGKASVIEARWLDVVAEWVHEDKVYSDEITDPRLRAEAMAVGNTAADALLNWGVTWKVPSKIFFAATRPLLIWQHWLQGETYNRAIESCARYD